MLCSPYEIHASTYPSDWTAFRARGRKRIVMAPACPEAGRITAGGVQHVNGVPVCQSSYADDLVHAATTSRNADLLPYASADVTILDAVTQKELNQKVAAVEDVKDTLWVGSPGVAIALANRFAQARSDKLAIRMCNSILIVVGSANPVSRRQLTQVMQHPHTTYLMMPRDRVTAPAQSLSDLVEQAMDHFGECDTVIAAGGDKMEAALNRLGICQFSSVGELEHGFPLAMTTLPNGSSLTLGMKAGGFGVDTTLLSAVDVLWTRKEKAI